MEIFINRRLLDSMLDFARERHPYEIILLLRGNIGGQSIRVEDYLLPPFIRGGTSFAEFPIHMLPIDFSVVGTAHSHPSGSLTPSIGDLNNFYSRIMIIIASPYQESNIAALNSRGTGIPIRIEG